MDAQLIYRDKIVQLLFSVSDISQSPRNIEAMLGGGDDGEEGEVDSS